MKYASLLVPLLLAAFSVQAQTPTPPDRADAKSGAGTPRAEELFGIQNLHAWCAVPFDAKHRGPEERAAMLQKLGFKRFVYDWRAKDIHTFDAEIEALKKHGIDLTGWWSPTDA